MFEPAAAAAGRRVSIDSDALFAAEAPRFFAARVFAD